MLRVEFTIEGMSPIQFSAAIRTPKKKGETAEAYEERTWKERAHVGEDGKLFIPGMAIKRCLDDLARFQGEQIAGKGKKTYTATFKAGVMCVDPLSLGIAIDSARALWVHSSADGKQGGPKRVWKCFPVLDKWTASGTLYLVADTLIADPAKVREYLERAGVMIGIGAFRPINGGYFGRFKVTAWNVSEMAA